MVVNHGQEEATEASKKREGKKRSPINPKFSASARHYRFLFLV
jgi:hypothetical protein